MPVTCSIVRTTIAYLYAKVSQTINNIVSDTQLINHLIAPLLDIRKLSYCMSVSHPNHNLYTKNEVIKVIRYTESTSQFNCVASENRLSHSRAGTISRNLFWQPNSQPSILYRATNIITRYMGNQEISHKRNSHSINHCNHKLPSHHSYALDGV